MITVNISINTNTIFTRTATRIKDPDKNGMATYHVDNGQIIKHKPEDGAVVLASKMLETIKERL